MAWVFVLSQTCSVSEYLEYPEWKDTPSESSLSPSAYANAPFGSVGPFIYETVIHGFGVCTLFCGLVVNVYAPPPQLPNRLEQQIVFRARLRTID